LSEVEVLFDDRAATRTDEFLGVLALPGARRLRVLIVLRRTATVEGTLRSLLIGQLFGTDDSDQWHHNNKPKPWIVDHYFGKHNKFRNDRWVFGDPESNAYLVKFSWTDIVRHVMVTGAASPDDPALTDYWAKRRRKVKPPLDSYTLRLLARQDARCPLCGDHLLAADQPPQSPHEWERW